MKKLQLRKLDHREEGFNQDNLEFKKIELTKQKTKEEKRPSSKKKKIVLGIVAGSGAILITIILLALFGLVIPGKKALASAETIKTKALELRLIVTEKDLSKIKTKLNEINNELDNFESQFNKMFFAKSVPILKKYYSDGKKIVTSGRSAIKASQILVEAVEPYQDFLGLKTNEEEIDTADKTTEERIDFLVESIEGIKPRLDEIEAEIKTIQENISQIDPLDYPIEFRGIEIRDKIILADNLITQANSFIKEGRPMIENLDWLLGKDEPRNYLFLFQNDTELRPTGGFWTAYGIIQVDEGKFSPSVSADIYSLDAQFNSNIPAPREIKAYHKNVYYLYLRDINLSPSFKQSVEDFLEQYQKISKNKFDAVFAVDTQVLVDILKVTGTLGVPGWGNFSPEPDDRCWGCPQVVYQLELLADKPTHSIVENRKGFLAPLMHSIIANALGSPKETVAELANTIFADLGKKHILTYFPDETLQKSAEALGIAGTIDEHEGDYLHINNTNFAGAKSNLFIDQEVEEKFDIKNDGSVTKKVTVIFKNTAPASDCNLERGNLCLNGLYRNWFRFYVPIGSELIKMTGSEVEAVVYEDLGKTVFEGFYGDKFPLYPEGIARISVEYKLPFKAENRTIKELIQKQPGTRAIKYSISVNGEIKEEFDFEKDTSLIIRAE